MDIHGLNSSSSSSSSSSSYCIPNHLIDLPSIHIIGNSSVGKHSILKRLLSSTSSSSNNSWSISKSNSTCHSWNIDTKYYSADVLLFVSRMDDIPFIKKLIKQCQALVMVFDLSDMSSFESIREFVSSTDISLHDILLCIGNKCDRIHDHPAHATYRRTNLNRRSALDPSSPSSIISSSVSSISSSMPVHDFNVDTSDVVALLDHGDDSCKGEQVRERVTALERVQSESPNQVWDQVRDQVQEEVDLSLSERHALIMEWCLDNGVEYVETCAVNREFEKCISLYDEDDVQGIDRIHAALSAHMWTGLTLKSESKSKSTLLSSQLENILRTLPERFMKNKQSEDDMDNEDVDDDEDGDFIGDDVDKFNAYKPLDEDYEVSDEEYSTDPMLPGHHPHEDEIQSLSDNFPAHAHENSEEDKKGNEDGRNKDELTKGQKLSGENEKTKSKSIQFPNQTWVRFDSNQTEAAPSTEPKSEPDSGGSKTGTKPSSKPDPQTKFEAEAKLETRPDSRPGKISIPDSESVVGLDNNHFDSVRSEPKAEVCEARQVSESHRPNDEILNAKGKSMSETNSSEGKDIMSTDKKLHNAKDDYRYETTTAITENVDIDSKLNAAERKEERELDEDVGFRGLENLMSQVYAIRTNSRGVGDQVRRENAARIALRMAELMGWEEEEDSD